MTPRTFPYKLLKLTNTTIMPRMIGKNLRKSHKMQRESIFEFIITHVFELNLCIFTYGSIKEGMVHSYR